MAVVMAVVGCLVLVVGLFDTLGRLRTPSTRSAIDEFLAEPPGNSLGIETAQVVELMRALAFVSGALAATGLVLAIYVMQRHRVARVGFTVVAVLLVLTVPVTGFMPFFLAVAAILLWSQPARDWYVGRVPAAAGVPSAALLSQQDPGPTGPTGSQSDQPSPSAPQPGAWGRQPYGQATPPPYGQPFGQPFGQPASGQGYDLPPFPTGTEQYPYLPQPGLAPAPKRPTTVTVAAVLTWIGAGLATLMMLMFMGVLALGGDAFIDEFERAAQDSQVDFTADQALAVGWVVAVVMLVWALSAVVLAIFALRRSNVARILLVVSAGMTALLSLLAITSILPIVTLLMGGATVILLFTGGANEWYSRRSSGPGMPSHPTQYPTQGQYPPPGQYPQQPPMPSQYPDQPEPPKRNQPW